MPVVPDHIWTTAGQALEFLAGNLETARQPHTASAVRGLLMVLRNIYRLQKH